MQPRLCALFLLDMMEWSPQINVLVVTLSVFAGHYIPPSLFNGLEGLKNVLLGDVKEFNRVQLVIIENHMTSTVYVQWGSAKDDAVRFVDSIGVQPKTAIGQKIHYRNSRFSSDRHTVQIWKENHTEADNVFSLLWQPGDDHHTTIFIIKETEITLKRNPEVRNWVKGDIKLYKDK